jgi:hypothetical protein
MPTYYITAVVETGDEEQSQEEVEQLVREMLGRDGGWYVVSLNAMPA